MSSVKVIRASMTTADIQVNDSVYQFTCARSRHPATQVVVCTKLVADNDLPEGIHLVDLRKKAAHAIDNARRRAFKI